MINRSPHVSISKSKKFAKLGQKLFRYAAEIEPELGVVFSDNKEFLEKILTMDLSEFRADPTTELKG